jgi:hypothetical protein
MPLQARIRLEPIPKIRPRLSHVEISRELDLDQIGWSIRNSEGGMTVEDVAGKTALPAVRESVSPMPVFDAVGHKVTGVFATWGE